MAVKVVSERLRNLLMYDLIFAKPYLYVFMSNIWPPNALVSYISKKLAAIEVHAQISIRRETPVKLPVYCLTYPAK